MKTPEFAWGTSWRPKHADLVDASVVGQAALNLAASSPDGVCTPHALRDAARAEDSELHPLFEWDDSIAAEEHRLDQARRILRAIVIKSPEPEKKVLTPAFINVKTTSQGYAPLATVLSSEELHTQAVEAALAAVRSLQRRYEMLKELEPLWAALDKLQAAVD